MIAGRLHWKKRGAKPPGKIGLAAPISRARSFSRKPANAAYFLASRVARRPSWPSTTPAASKCSTLTAGQFLAALRAKPRLTAPADRSALLSASAMPTPTKSCTAARLSPPRLDAPPHGRRNRAPLRRHAQHPARLAPAPRREVRRLQAWPGVFAQWPSGRFDNRARCGAQGAAHRLRRQRNELLPALNQTDNKILADRSLSRLLKDDWPRALEA